MAATGNFLPIGWYGVTGGRVRRPSAAKIKASKRIFQGALVMAIAGVAMPLLGGTDLQAVVTQLSGADANGHVFVRARTAGVTIALVSGGNSKVLGVTSITYGTTTAVLIQLGTDGGGAVTTTGLQLADLIRGHAELSKLVRAEAGGTGASILVAAAAAPILQAELLGVAQRESNNTAVADADIDPAVAFEVGHYAVAPTAANKLPSDGGYGYLLDDNTCTSDSDGLNFRCPTQIHGGIAYLNLAEAE